MTTSKRVLFVILWFACTTVAAEDPGGSNALEGNDFSRTIDGSSWLLSFGDSNLLRVYLDGEEEASVSYAVAGNEVQLTDREGSCQGDQATGLYRWALAENVLSMEALNDPCERRRGVLTGGEWQIRDVE
jgi:hypothetical protein